MFKFEGLKNVLIENNEIEITLNFKALNSLICGGLNENAFSSRSYFSNDKTHAIAKAWFDCGYYCRKVDKNNKFIILRKIEKCNRKMISSFFLFRHLRYNELLTFIPVLTPFTFIELCRMGVNQKYLKEYLLSSNAVFVDFKGCDISFDMFYDIVNNLLSERMAHTYECLVKYVFGTCFLNVDIDVNEIIECVNYDKIPIYYFGSYPNAYFLRKTFNYMCENLNLNRTSEDIINAICELNIDKLQRFMATGDPLEILFYDYVTNNFIKNLKENNCFIIDPSIVEEMLNVSLLSQKKEFVYLTHQQDIKDILVSSVKNRVLIG